MRDLAFRKGLLSPFSFGAGLLLLALSPLIRGGNRHVALIALEWLALLVLGCLLTQHLLGTHQSPIAASTQDDFCPRLSILDWFLLLSPAVTALLFLTPVPVALWRELPGRDVYLPAISSSWLPITLTPDATAASLLASLPIAATFLWSRHASSAQFKLIPIVLVMLAVVQAIWGLLQVGPFKGLYFDAEFAGNAIGSFANANHFANYLGMCLPLAVFLLWQSLPALQSRKTVQHPGAIALWSVTLFVILAGLLASASRTGSASALVVMATTLAILFWLSPTGDRTRGGPLLAAGGLLLAVLVAVGSSTFLSRLSTGSLGPDVALRWQEISSSWQGVKAFWPVGAGPGSFALVYPQFQAPGMVGFLEHTHNDYVQLWFEMGALSVALMGVLIWVLLRQARKLWRDAGQQPNSDDLTNIKLQLCCGAGALAIAMHSLLDFNLHIPTNAMLAACLLGGFMRPSQSTET